MVDEHDGQVPDSLAALLALPGIGPYTARAVLAFAFGRDVGVIDTNAGRIVARAVAGRPVRISEAQQLVDAMVPAGEGWAFGQALLDLGAMVCVAGSPRCGDCPIRRRCRWATAGRHAPDPASGSAGATGRQAVFEGSDRQGRGRMIDRLRLGPASSERLSVVTGWSRQPERLARVIGDLVDEGLVVRETSGSLRLP